jgi:hypothetical protein
MIREPSIGRMTQYFVPIKPLRRAKLFQEFLSIDQLEHHEISFSTAMQFSRFDADM